MEVEEVANETARHALAQLIEREPQRHPLILGFVAAIGTPLDPVVQAFQESLRRFDYSSEEIHLSWLLDDLPYQPWGVLPGRSESDYYERRMDAGDRLRTDVGNGASLAALAVAKISEHRSQCNGNITQAYLLRSLKHPAEVELLRHIYGDAFSLVAVACSSDERRESLSDSLSLFEAPRAKAEQLISRDQSDLNDQEFGQNVLITYSMADVFVPVGRGIDPSIHIDRFVDSIFGSPFLTPDSQEEAMRFAQDASLRSASAGRQVGAALIPKIGTPIVIGTNEVPKPGGGQYWTGDIPDYRDFRTGQDPNPIYTKRVVQELLERLEEHDWLKDELKGLSGSELLAKAEEIDKSGISLMSGTRAASLIEFTRCLHAEQAVIVNAARAGVSTDGAILFSTTFPCHECAKMIIGSGVIEVFYIEPYPKSLVDRLYRDLIDTSPSVSSGSALVEEKIPFRQFLGIAPRRYSLAFTAGRRRVGDDIIKFDRRTANPRTNGWNETSIELQEDKAVASVTRVLKELAASELEQDQSSEQKDTDESKIDLIHRSDQVG